MKLTEAELEAQLVADPQEAARPCAAKRPRPLTDTKILTADNGLMIGGLADAGRILKEPRYIAAAEKAADFVLAKLRTPDGRLLRTYAGGRGQAQRLPERLRVPRRRPDSPAPGDRRQAVARRGRRHHRRSRSSCSPTSRAAAFFFTSSDHEALLARAQGAGRQRPARRQLGRRHNLISLAVVLEEARVFAAGRKNHRRDRRRHAKLARRRTVDDHGDSGLIEARAKLAGQPKQGN